MSEEYETLIETIRKRPVPEFVEHFNERGRDGWWIVHITHGDLDIQVVYQRRRSLGLRGA